LSLRYVCVVILLLPLCLHFRPALPNSPAQWLHLAFVGFLIQVVYFGTAWTAFELGGSAGTVALVTSLQPLLVAIAMPMLSSERVSARHWCGLLLGFTGAAIVIVGNEGVHGVSAQVFVFSVAALLAFSLATVWEKRFGVAHHPLTSNTVQYVVGFAFTLPLAWFVEDMHVTVTVPFVLALAYLVIGNSILAISLLLMMIRQGDATRVSASFFLVPPLTAVIAWWVLDERMLPLAWAGMVIAAVGVWLVTRRATL